MANVHFSSKSDEWETPPELFKKYDDVYHFDIDVCASPANALCARYFDASSDCLAQPWAPMTCWMNPPYGRGIGKFIAKAREESMLGATVVCLIPSRTDTAWWHDYVMWGEVTYLRGRIKFDNRTFPSWRADGSHKKSSAPFPSAVVVFEPPVVE